MSHRRIPLFSVLAVLLVSLWSPVPQFVGPGVLRADDRTPTESTREDVKRRKPSMADYIRLEKDRDGEPLELQTAVTRFAAPGEDGVTVDLVGVVHIGDAAYYKQLNRTFRKYDAVLYELVAPPEKAVPQPGAGADNPLRMVQKLMESVVDLEHQLDVVDYTRPNVVHADLSPREMQEAMAERGEDAVTLTLGIAADMLRQRNIEARRATSDDDYADPQPFADIDPERILFDEYGATKLKRVFARQFASMGSRDGTGLGRTIKTILVDDRNAAAMQVLNQEIAKGRKRLAIFYGAAHMPDFEERLTADLGLVRRETTWLPAWDLTLQRKAPVEGVVESVIEELIRSALEQ